MSRSNTEPRNLVDSAIREGTQGMRGPFDHGRVRQIAGAVAHKAVRESLATATGPGLVRAAECLGARLDLSFEQHPVPAGLWSERRIVDPVTVKERKKYGYGQLPDALIREVEGPAISLMPDYVGPDTAKRLAALTMRLVRPSPAISSDLLWQLIDKQQPLAGEGPLDPELAGACLAVVNTTHLITAYHPTTPNHLIAVPEIDRG